MQREFLQDLRIGEDGLPEEVIQAILEESDRETQDWAEKYDRAAADHQAQLGALRLETALHTAVAKAGGRNAKAIGALVDMQAVAGAEDMAAAMDAAVAAVKQEAAYLFGAAQAPAYAAGTGTHAPHTRPTTLAEALRERSGR